MQMNSKTTVTDLLFSGAYIEGAHGQSLAEIMSVGLDENWIHDLPVSKLIEKDAIVYLPNGLNLSRKGHKVALNDDFGRSPTVEFDNSETGFKHLSSFMNRPPANIAHTIGHFSCESVLA